MEQHVKIVAILNIVLGALGVCIALAMLLFFGGLAAVEESEAQTGDPVLGLVGAVVFFVIAVFSVPSLISGVGLLKFRGWARPLTVVVSALNLLSIPFGTIVGIYGLWVLLNKETGPLFQARNAV